MKVPRMEVSVLKTSKTISLIESSSVLDPLVSAFQSSVEPLFEKAPNLRNALRGEWMDHPIHPLLTVGTIGLLSAASLLDFVAPKSARSASQRLIGLGVLSAIPTVLAGVAELATRTEGQTERRVGIAHAVSNTLALTLYCASWNARRRGKHLRGILLSTMGSAFLGAGGYVGGHLTYRMGIGVEKLS